MLTDLSRLVIFPETHIRFNFLSVHVSGEIISAKVLESFNVKISVYHVRINPHSDIVSELKIVEMHLYPVKFCQLPFIDL